MKCRLGGCGKNVENARSAISTGQTIDATMLSVLKGHNELTVHRTDATEWWQGAIGRSDRHNELTVHRTDATTKNLKDKRAYTAQ
jgi:hypothetical protein